MKRILTYSCLLILATSLLSPLNAQETKPTDTVQEAWINAFNQTQDLAPFLTEQSGILHQNELTLGVMPVIDQWKKLHARSGTIEAFESQAFQQLRPGQKFELGRYEMQDGTFYRTIIGWRMQEEWIKEVEVVYLEGAYTSSGEGAVDEGRKRWQDLSNQHRPDLIASEVFSEDGVYFNRGNRYDGPAIAGAYDYMEKPSYRITLEALNVVQVNPDVVYEIGVFETNGKGLYILIWTREEAAWKLLMDFNF